MKFLKDAEAIEQNGALAMSLSNGLPQIWPEGSKEIKLWSEYP